MSGKIQLVIDRGILEEDPDGTLWLSAKAKDVINSIEADDNLMTIIKNKAVDGEDARTGFWTLVFIKCCPDVTSKEVSDAVQVLLGWQRGATEARLSEWSMKSRIS